MIDLLNRRFVPYFFNTGGPGEGHNVAATDFVAGKVPNPWAYLAAFAPDGELLAQTDIYDGTDQVFALLQALLRRHPEFDLPTADESAALADIATSGDAAAVLAAAGIAEQLGRFDAAGLGYQRVVELGNATERAAAWRGALRVTRGAGHWPAHHAVLAQAEHCDVAAALATDLAIERGLRALAQKRYAAARVALEPAIADAQQSPRLAELHYEAGRACWFLGDRNWAKAHWCWILEHRPDDRFMMRARLAAGAEGFPYTNHELGGFEGDTGPVGPGALDAAVRSAQRSAAALLARIDRDDYDTAPAVASARDEPDVDLPSAAAPTVDPVDAPASLVARLGSAKDDTARTAMVAAIGRLGVDALGPLSVAVNNKKFAGRAGAIAAAGAVFATMAPGTGLETVEEGMRMHFLRVLREASRSGEAAIAAAARPALAAYERLFGRTEEISPEDRDERQTSPAAPAKAPTDPAATTPLPDSPLLLVAALRDGNSHVPANNRVVEALVALGDAAVRPLCAAIEDQRFPGRGYSAWALALVIKPMAARPQAALAALQAACDDDNDYVRTLARSGNSQLR